MIRQRHYSYDVIKIIATIFIIFHHYQQGEGITFEHVNFFGGKFYFGLLVELFFMLSGFFMLKYVDDIKKGMSFRGFFLHRYFRVLPMLFLSAIVFQIIRSYYTFLETGVPNSETYSLWKTITSAFGIHVGSIFESGGLEVNNPTWYISVLLVCYLYFYVVTWTSSKLKISSWYLYGFMIILGTWVYKSRTSLPLLMASTGRGLKPFFWGLILAKAFSEKEKWVTTKSRIPIILYVLIVLMGVPVLILSQSVFVSYGIEDIMIFIYYPTLLYLFDTEIIKKVFQFKWIGILAHIAFNAYIWHVCIRNLMDILLKKRILQFDHTTHAAMLIHTVIVFLIAALSYYCIERPISKKLTHILLKIRWE